MADLPLIQRFPAIGDRLPRIALAALPTPIERLADDLWVKRDDLTSPEYGGNKVRKLEFLLGDARRRAATRLITIGAVGSHHALATTIHGRAAGFGVTAVLLPQPVTPHVSAVLRTMLAHGADVRLARTPLLVPWGMLRARLAWRGEQVRVIPAGGSDARGTLGYVNAALELGQQVAAHEAPEPRTIHVAGGTLGTAVGLAIGAALAGLDTRVVAHRITSRAITNRRRLRKLVRHTLRLLRRSGAANLAGGDAVLERLRIDHAQVGAGYGHATDAGQQALAWFAGHGIRLDPTYTAKAAAGALAAAADASDAGPRLYWHTLSSTEDLTPARRLRADAIPETLRPFAPPLAPE